MTRDRWDDADDPEDSRKARRRRRRRRRRSGRMLSVEERAYREALSLDPAMAEAWNGLGFALRNQRKYPESIDAYEEALKRRPHYAQALEYLGEAYVQMGRLDEARAIHARLQPLDAREARELAKAIEKAARR